MRFLIAKSVLGKTLNELTNFSPECKKLSLTQFSRSFTKATEQNSPVEVSWDVGRRARWAGGLMWHL